MAGLQKSADGATAPNTPPCMVIVFTARLMVARSVAPQQSSSNRHSKPRSLASRIVVWTHHVGGDAGQD